MADRLIENRGARRKARRVSTRVAAAVSALLLPVFAHAEVLPDPTRIPASIATPVEAGVAEAPPAGLQSIIISKTRRAAIIDGETVELGGKHGDARLVEVNEGSVVLRGAQGRQVMTLFPGVKMVSRKEVSPKPQPTAKKAQPGKWKSGPAAHKEKK